MTDVLVIGAGPAGSIAASFIHQAGYSVRVVERERFPRFVIGESLLPRCMEVLEEAQLLDAVKQKGFQQKFGARFLKGDLVSDFNFNEQYTKGWNWTWQVPRAEFDQTLIDAAIQKGISVNFETTVTDIEIYANEESTTTVVNNKTGIAEKIHARFIVDASGYGRVIPRLFKLDRPSNLDPRKALFAHIHDENRNNFDDPNRIIVVIYAPGIWVWIIPFSTGITSLGFVGPEKFFSSLPGKSNSEQFQYLINSHAYLQHRFGDQQFIFEARTLQSWSATSEKFNGPGYVLTGNVTEFLDPIFSSGVMFATVSSALASKAVIQKLKGEPVDWVKDYQHVIQQGVDTFRTYVMAWYDGTLDKIFFSNSPDPLIKSQICSVLAGYVWDETNPFVHHHTESIKRLAKLIDIQARLDELNPSA